MKGNDEICWFKLRVAEQAVNEKECIATKHLNNARIVTESKVLC
jgi:hypothetical protein